MPKVAGAAGVRVARKGPTDGKPSTEPKKEKRRKAKRACRPCQVAHLTCGRCSPLLLVEMGRRAVEPG